MSDKTWGERVIERFESSAPVPPEWDFDVWREGDEVHVRGILWPHVVEVFSLDSAARIAHDLETSPDPADRQLAADMLAACGGA